MYIFSSQVQYIIKQTGEENKEIYPQVSFVWTSSNSHNWHKSNVCQSVRRIYIQFLGVKGKLLTYIKDPPTPLWEMNSVAIDRGFRKVQILPIRNNNLFIL